ncbi:MAG: FUN14 domain-containing protein [Nitrososphaeraceae archaeon]
MIKNVIKLAAIIIGLFVAALAYLEYQRIVNLDWNRIQVVSQNGVAWITDTITHIPNTIDATHSGTCLGA